MGKEEPIIQMGNRPVSSNALRLDSWTNFASGLGVTGTDNVQSLLPSMPLRLTEVDYNNLWRGDGFARRIVSQMVYDGMRAGYQMNGIDETIEEKLVDRMHNLHVDSAIRNWWRWGRLHGGSVIFMGINDGEKDLTTPFDITRSDYKVMFLKVFDRWRVNPYPEVDTDPTSPTFGQVTIYKIAPLSGGAFDVHRSRLIVYDGEPLTDTERLRNNRWGDSVLTACYSQLRSLQNVLMNCDHIIADYVQGVMKVTDLMGIIESGQMGTLLSRIKLMELTKSTLRTVLIDSEEDYSRISTTITGIEHIVDKFAEALAGSYGMPVKLLMGVAPKGLQATGDADIRQWYDLVANAQEERYEPALRQLIDILAGEMNIDLESYDIKFNPLWQQDAKDEAETRWLHAQTDEKYLSYNIVTPDEIRQQRFGQQEYGNEVIGVDIQDIKKLPPSTDMGERGTVIPAGVGPEQNALIPGSMSSVGLVAPQQA